jgi:hypothetical protein
MSMVAREAGTYRTSLGSLVHFRPTPDGSLILEAEGARAVPPGDDLVKLSDDPNWPDLERRVPDVELFTD